MLQRHWIFIFATVLFIPREISYATQKFLKVDVDLVMVNVAVVDSENRSVMDLKANNFHIFEDKVEQQIRYFSSEAAPLSLGIVFDISQSMERKLDFAKQAAMKFLETGTPDDEYFLVEFTTHARVAEGFTSDIRRLRDQFSLKAAEGNTALYDALYLGLSKLKSGQNPKKALLLITDGVDNHSRYSHGDIRDVLRESDAQLYVVDLGQSLIADLADMTGGHSYHTSVNDLEDTCEKIALELKNQYVIGYESTNENKDGKFRKLRVRVTPPVGMSKLNVHAREGYFGAK
jgi:Ca-activated chloride channel family protein